VDNTRYARVTIT